METLKQQIINAKTNNPSWGYRKISQLLKCSPNSVRFHLKDDVQIEYKHRKNQYRRHASDALKRKFGAKCSRCNYDKYLGALHFHHLDPKTKQYNVNTLIGLGKLELAEQEALKCILVCANCHAELHAKT